VRANSWDAAGKIIRIFFLNWNIYL
jgi:hypothetical protein